MAHINDAMNLIQNADWTRSSRGGGRTRLSESEYRAQRRQQAEQDWESLPTEVQTSLLENIQQNRTNWTKVKNILYGTDEFDGIFQQLGITPEASKHMRTRHQDPETDRRINDQDTDLKLGDFPEEEVERFYAPMRELLSEILEYDSPADF